MRGYASILALGLVLAACSGSEAATTTVASTTTAVPTTTTVVEATTTTTLPATTTTSAEVDGVPPEALALIGAPMPEVPEYPDGFDAEVWFEAYAAWNQWAFANPEEGLESLDLWVVPGSEYAEGLGTQLRGQIDSGWVSVVDGSVDLIDFEVADEFAGDGLVVINGLTKASGGVWVLEGDNVVLQESFDESEPIRSLVAVEEVAGLWLLQGWD